jgi:WD40 repeat protein
MWPAAAVAPSVKPVALHTLAGHADEVYALDWAPAGETLASGSKDRLVKMCVRSARTGNRGAQPPFINATTLHSPPLPPRAQVAAMSRDKA